MIICPKCKKEISLLRQRSKDVPLDTELALKYLLKKEDSGSEELVKQLGRGEIGVADIISMAKLERNKGFLPKILTDKLLLELRILKICPYCTSVLRPFYNKSAFIVVWLTFFLYVLYSFISSGDMADVMKYRLEIFFSMFLVFAVPIFLLGNSRFWEYVVIENIDKGSADLKIRTGKVFLILGIYLTFIMLFQFISIFGTSLPAEWIRIVISLHIINNLLLPALSFYILVVKR